ncbi:MAG: ABC transporter permease subunit, partial [Desulfobacterales bacterium]|nr:ABC transporter permease subunit [Desulfobacterales bacterium]
LAALWQWAAWAFSDLVVAAPLETLSAVLALVSDSDFIFNHFLVTLGRMALALAVGIGVGGILGIAAGLAPGVRPLVEPLRWMLMTVPGVVIVVVFMLWFGMGTAMVVAIAASMGAPVIFVHVADAMALADEDLLEMARVYRFGFRGRLIRIYAMAVAGPFFSALVVAAGNTVRVVVLAEVLGANQGLGHCLAMARTHLDTPVLYALALISMSMVGGMEFFVLRPLEKRLVWKG